MEGQEVASANGGILDANHGFRLPFTRQAHNIFGPISLRDSDRPVFFATQYDRALRAYDLQDGRVAWSAELPAGPQATPMVYEWNGKAHVVLTLGGRKEKR